MNTFSGSSHRIRTGGDEDLAIDQIRKYFDADSRERWGITTEDAIVSQVVRFALAQAFAALEALPSDGTGPEAEAMWQEFERHRNVRLSRREIEHAEYEARKAVSDAARKREAHAVKVAKREAIAQLAAERAAAEQQELAERVATIAARNSVTAAEQAEAARVLSRTPLPPSPTAELLKEIDADKRKAAVHESGLDAEIRKTRAAMRKRDKATLGR